MGSSLSLYRGNFRYLHNLLYVGGLDRPIAAGIVLYQELCVIDVAFGLPHRQPILHVCWPFSNLK